ncbi:MAG: type II toxin-antitoxin system HicA family toxin [Methanoregula sp.]|jgi:predicted RNA binding protein YcfA (HicA-like mRNA interferase family)|nr:type II toxin-antitoxin system HicA family toxin [Methanoregula sp.]
MKFLQDVPQPKIIRTFEVLGFRIIRVGNHISMQRENPDGTKTPLTMPNHERIKGSTLRIICTQARVSRDDFLDAFNRS